MSAQQVQSITAACKAAWQQLLTGEDYEGFKERMKASGKYWGAL